MEREYNSHSLELEFDKQLKKTMFLLGTGLFITILTVISLLNTRSVVLAMINNVSILFPILMLVEVFLVIGITKGVYKYDTITLKLMFFVYSVITGVTLLPIMIVTDLQIVLSALIATFILFAVMAAYGYITKRPLYKMQNLLHVGLIFLIIVSLINIFIGLPLVDMVISIVGALMFLAYTAYDVQVIKKTTMYMIRKGGVSEADRLMDNIAIIGALKLYLDFVNLFIYLIRIFSGRQKD